MIHMLKDCAEHHTWQMPLRWLGRWFADKRKVHHHDLLICYTARRRQVVKEKEAAEERTACRVHAF